MSASQKPHHVSASPLLSKALRECNVSALAHGTIKFNPAVVVIEGIDVKGVKIRKVTFDKSVPIPRSPQRLSSKERAVLIHALYYTWGVMQVDIAMALEISQSLVSKALNTPLPTAK